MARRAENKKAGAPPTNVVLVDNWTIKGFVPKRPGLEKETMNMVFFIEGRNNKTGAKERTRLAFSSEDTVAFILDTAKVFSSVMNDARNLLVNSPASRFTEQELDASVEFTKSLIEVADGMHRVLEWYKDAKDKAWPEA